MASSDPYYDILTSAIRTPEQFKLCTVCGNVVDLEADECNFCCAYRFDADPEHVSNSALDQATHPRTAITDTAPLAED